MTQQNLYKIQSIDMASLTTNIDENTTPETTTIVSYRRNYIKNYAPFYILVLIQHFFNNNEISQKLTTHIHIHI